MSAAAKQVTRDLRARGYTLSYWAREHGYHPQAAWNAVNRYAGHPDREPWGRTTFAILRDLSREIGREIVPGVLTDTTEAP